MGSKNRKYFIFEKIFTFFDKQNKNIFLFMHMHNMTILENNFISSYCLENKIHTLNVKSNLYNKVFKNKKFLNLFSGPTKIFVFENFNSFILFSKNDYIIKNFIPLTVFWNNTFFLYSFFITNIFSIYINDNKFFDDSFLKINNFIYGLKNPVFNFLKILNLNLFFKKQMNYENNLINNLIIRVINVNDKKISKC